MSELDIYFKLLKENIDISYNIASIARSKGFDPVNNVECPLALNMAERVVNLIKTIYNKIPVKDIVKRIIELENKFGKLDIMVSFSIAKEISKGKFGKFSNEIERIDIGIRIAFAYMTLGIVSSPIEGYTGLKLGNTKSGKKYFIANFSGPIRSAGTTSVCLLLLLIDYLRELYGYAEYDITENEIMRYVQENKDFHENIANLQYFPNEEEMIFLAKNLSIQIDGAPTEKLDVSNFKDLKRISTNKIRGGMCLVFSEGLAQKIEKAWGRLNNAKKKGLIYNGFKWVEEYIILHKKQQKTTQKTSTYIESLAAGRPIYGYPAKSGGFRFRYGRSRTSGFSAVSINPATMGITGGFLSNGTQLKLEKPIKGCIITSCDSIEGPIIKLKNGSVKKINNYNEALNLYKSGKISEIIYLGDILFSIGDIIDRNTDLIKPGYVSEWWEAELGKNIKDLDLDLAIKLSNDYNIPLHPDFVFYWSQISTKEFNNLLKWLNISSWRDNKLFLKWEQKERDQFKLGKRALELLGIEHDVNKDNIIINKEGRVLFFNLGKTDPKNFRKFDTNNNNEDVLDLVNKLCSCVIKDKAGTFVGARMGRPEKSKLRKISGSPNVLFPIKNYTNKEKNIINKDFVNNDFPMYECECGNKSIYKKCEICGKTGHLMFFCEICNDFKKNGCNLHKKYKIKGPQIVNVKKYLDIAVKKLNINKKDIPSVINGVSKLNNESGIPENLTKGILRAKFDLNVNKDGTIRYDATEIPLTHFKPVEIGTNIDLLKKLGYLKDIFGKDLVNEYQLLEIMPHDIILSNSSVLGKESADNVFLNVANFIDKELELLYNMDKFYNFKDTIDLIGVEVVCIAPHNCAGVIGRIIGFSDMQGILASPYIHAAMRRDCDGDEASIILLMDVLLNFSLKFLPNHRGGSQDAPLVLNAKINAGEVDDQILFFEGCKKYPLNLYKFAEQELPSTSIRKEINLISDKLKLGKSGFVGNDFTHNSNNFNNGNNNGIYKTLATMGEKVDFQMELSKKLRSVDENDVAQLIIEKHFLKDISGNLNKFMKQSFVCSNCGRKFRRPPLSGFCSKCLGKLRLTVNVGSIRKYLQPSLELSKNYNISNYIQESLELMEDYINSLFIK